MQVGEEWTVHKKLLRETSIDGIDSLLTEGDFARAAPDVSLHAELLGVYIPGDSKIWRAAGRLDGYTAHQPLPPLESGWL